MAKMHKDYTIADMMRLGGAWVKTHADIDAVRLIYSTLIAFDKSPADVTIERFMNDDKSIVSDVATVRQLCIGAEAPVHAVKAAIKVSAMSALEVKRSMTIFSNSIDTLVDARNNLIGRLSSTHASIVSALASVASSLVDITANPTESSTFEFLAKDGDDMYFIQSVATNLSRVNADGDVCQKCLGRYVVKIRTENDRLYIKVVASINGLSNDGYIHPNVDNSGGICYGDSASTADAYRSRRDIDSLLALTDKLLRTSQYGSPYRHLDGFNASSLGTNATRPIPDDVMSKLNEISADIMAVNAGDQELTMVPDEKIKALVRLDENGHTQISETDLEGVVRVLNSSTIKYAPSFLFAPVKTYDVPSVGVFLCGNGMVVDGVNHGVVNRYVEPVQIQTVDRPTEDGVYRCIYSGHYAIVKIRNGEICAGLAIDAGEVVHILAENVDKVLFAELPAPIVSTVVVWDTGEGLLAVADGAQIAHIVDNEIFLDVSVEIEDTMTMYSL